MAVEQETNLSNQNSWLQLDSLYCEEEGKWEEEEEGASSEEQSSFSPPDEINPFLFPCLSKDQDEFLEDEELFSLLSKEVKQHFSMVYQQGNVESHLSTLRCEAVKWMLKVNAHFGFSTLTAVLAINYFDRFISTLEVQRDKPWIIQLLVVACISLATKVEETHVPLLVDLQVEDIKYVFEAKTIQKMELLVLSTLEWKMHPVTPISFLHHFMTRIGLKPNLHCLFLKKCESLLLSFVPDSSILCFLPSVLATATMLHVIEKIDPINAIEYQNKLMGISSKINKENVNECYQLINKMSKTCVCTCGQNNPHKRKHEQIPGSPTGVIDASFSCDSSNDSWAVGSSSSSQEPFLKKIRSHEEDSLNMIFGDEMSSLN